MTEGDRKLANALLHHVNVTLGSDDPANVARERDLDDVKRATKLAEPIVNGEATAADKATVADIVHPQVRSSVCRQLAS